MGIKINVDPAKLDAGATQIEQQTAQYEKTYRMLFKEVEALGSAWQGKDNVAFVNQIKGFEKDFKAMSALMREYSSFLRFGAKSYRDTQNERVVQAKRLTN